MVDVLDLAFPDKEEYFHVLGTGFEFEKHHLVELIVHGIHLQEVS